jgi:hypothetical protein
VLKKVSLIVGVLDGWANIFSALLTEKTLSA